MENPLFSGMADPGRRFDRMARVVGHEAMARLKRSHVMIIGVGGVGSWAAEAVARSAVGRVTVVDFDTVCISNFNRQLQAVEGSIGGAKAALLAERLRSINPDAVIEGVDGRFSPDTCDGLMSRGPDMVIDAIDHVTSKCFLIDYCRRKSINIVVSTGSGGRLDPTLVRVTDLGRTEGDPLARAVRGILRAKYGFPAKGDFGVPAVCTLEPHRTPLPQPEGGSGVRDRAGKSVVMGTAGFVTGAFGLACASAAVNVLLKD